jgi:tRNA-Thr(GGU) m(6)t(6)A37 methyltransferase TsaA
MKAIGHVKSCYRDKFGTPRQPGLTPSSKAQIIIDKQWQPESALQGLDGFSHLWILFHFHQNKQTRYHAKVHPPRLGGEPIGVFATRSPHRPNAIGMSVVKIVKIEEAVITVSGVDLVDGTPVLDIKPYLPEVESIPEAKSGWTTDRPKKNWSLQWTKTQLDFVEKWSKISGEPKLKSLIEETLTLDPRPLLYQGSEGSAEAYKETHAVRLFTGDVHFAFLSSGQIEIRKIFSGLADLGNLQESSNPL